MTFSNESCLLLVIQWYIIMNKFAVNIDKTVTSIMFIIIIIMAIMLVMIVKIMLIKIKIKILTIMLLIITMNNEY